MVRFAVIQDGTELARQTEADISGCFERCAELLSAEGTPFEARLFTDETVGALLDRIEPDEYGCLVVASNALISGQIDRIVGRRQADVKRYLAAGGGIVVLHQLVDSLSRLLPDELRPSLVPRASANGSERTTAYDVEDILVCYPRPVDLADFVDGGFATGPPSLFYAAIDAAVPENLKPVLHYGVEPLLVRTYDHIAERVVVTTLPLDWQHQTDLLANAIRFAALGRPRRLIWRRPTIRSTLLVQWLSGDGAASVRPAVADGDPLPPTERWLLGNVDLVVAPPDRLPGMRTRPEVARFLAEGGVLIAPQAETTGDAVGRITALLGRHTEYSLARRLHGELRAVTGWAAVDYAFELRNIVTALAFLARNPVNRWPGSVELGELAGLVPDLRDRLRDVRHREDLSSSLAHVQSMAFLCAPASLASGLYDWMDGDPRRARFDVALQIRAVKALGTRTPDAGFAAAATADLRAHRGDASLAAVIRVLDALAVLDQAELLALTHDEADRLLEIVCDILEENAPDPRLGWLSVEGSADVVRGLLAVNGRLDPDAAVATATRTAELVAVAADVLRQALHRYERNRKGVAWLARVVHGVIAAEQHFPIGLQRLAELDWPDRQPADTVGPPAATQDPGQDASLTEYLALENKALREREADYTDAVLAARVGRGAATLGGTALVVAPLGYVLVRLGADSVWSLIGNVTILLTAFLAVIAGVFAVLARFHLLAAPAQRVLEWIGATVPVLSALSRLRGRRSTSQ